jgi:hypothetical protein
LLRCLALPIFIQKSAVARNGALLALNETFSSFLAILGSKGYLEYECLTTNHLWHFSLFEAEENDLLLRVLPILNAVNRG